MKSYFLFELVIVFLGVIIIASAHAVTPQSNIDMRGTFNITNITHICSGSVCYYIPDFNASGGSDTNETVRVDDLYTNASAQLDLIESIDNHTATIDTNETDRVDILYLENISIWNYMESLLNESDSNETVRVDALVGNTTNVSFWNTAYSWGNHALAGYLTEETNETVRVDDLYNNVSAQLDLIESIDNHTATIDTNETVRVDALEQNASAQIDLIDGLSFSDTNETVRVDLLWTENISIWNYMESLLNETDTNETVRVDDLYTNASAQLDLIESIDNHTATIDTNETDRVDILYLENVSIWNYMESLLNESDSNETVRVDSITSTYLQNGSSAELLDLNVSDGNVTTNYGNLIQVNSSCTKIFGGTTVVLELGQC